MLIIHYSKLSLPKAMSSYKPYFWLCIKYSVCGSVGFIAPKISLSPLTMAIHIHLKHLELLFQSTEASHSISPEIPMYMH